MVGGRAFPRTLDPERIALLPARWGETSKPEEPSFPRPVSVFCRAGQRITALLEDKRRAMSRIIFLHLQLAAGLPTSRGKGELVEPQYVFGAVARATVTENIEPRGATTLHHYCR
jgi:hypothetical protein